ncbi:hypothetical protein BDV93DRAFT_510631 [Ceratobasidium sp. AG-I]|nr:hypothetical protein BDV93DRAFT_510631 [Ceratobasidium sp. AG-I]
MTLEFSGNWAMCGATSPDHVSVQPAIANPVPDGTYTICLPYNGGGITDTGEGRYLNILPSGALGDDADKIKAVYKPEKGAYSLQFARSGKYLTSANMIMRRTSIRTSYGQGSVTDPGEGRFLHVLPHGALGEDADKIAIKYNADRGAYSLKFTKSGKFLTHADEPLHPNIKMVDGDKPAYFKITPHEYEKDKFCISHADNREYHVGLAMERIFPPWVALSNFPERQPWTIKKA